MAYSEISVLLLLLVLVLFAGLFLRDRRRLADELRALRGAQEKNESFQLLNQSVIGLRQSVDAKIKEANDRLTTATNAFSQVQHALGRLDKLSESVEGLQSLMGSQKLRGGLGEQVMADVLAELIPPEHRELQVTLKSGARVDAVIKTSAGLVPIDAKFPLENYIKAVEATSDRDRESALHEFRKNARKHVRDIASRYICPGETVDFAVMYVPAESIFMAIQEDPEITADAARRRVFLVSPSTFCPLLSLIMLSLEGEHLAREARSVMTALRSIKQHAGQFEERLGVAARHVRNAQNAIGDATTGWNELRTSIDSAARLEVPEPDTGAEPPGPDPAIEGPGPDTGAEPPEPDPALKAAEPDTGVEPPKPVAGLETSKANGKP